MSYASLNRIVVDLEALRANFALLRERLAPGAGVLAVVKSDAYGHGLVPVARALAEAGAWGLGVSEVEEAVRLREAGLRCPVVLLSGLVPEAAEEVVHHGLLPGVTDRATLDALEGAAARADRAVPVHVKVDTGMGRLGFMPGELAELAAARADRWPHLRFEGLYTHLAAADDPADPLNREQIHRFREALELAEAAGWRPGLRHVVNSAGLLHFPEAHFDLARPGIALYGAHPGPVDPDLPLRPVMAVTSRIISVRDVPAGWPVSYGHAFVADRPTRVAVIPVGYDDGYLRRLSPGARVLVRGRPSPVIGRVCMKALMADVTDVAGAAPGDEAVLLGRQGRYDIRIEELADRAGTISYELLCLLGRRNQRIYRGAPCSG
ncbi:alanine racemase [Dissulfurirhabdus thermomarina]|uniref:Alanine racemase n=1 Tax=Dissulfurirhabdus thermomarina TaxID=1765737 RepID=A0A6N9TUW9_DISTH|nr:alanine racemase [Dissulfurirhabdus thermomarina]NDY43227.1 alanine racemase [Dissulfurirhabdus thermomarina]NMX22348.1 alanine racemase [Dissulfurirhabdus thermomarina]